MLFIYEIMKKLNNKVRRVLNFLISEKRKRGKIMLEIVNENMQVIQQVYLAADIQKILGIGKSKSYTFLDEVYKDENPPFRVLKIGKLFRVPKNGFDDWLNGQK